MKTIGTLLICGFVISSCGLMHFAEEPHPWPSEKRLLAKDWVVPQVASDEEQVYCYRTLGKVDCHGDPLGSEAQNRVLGNDEDSAVDTRIWKQ